MTPSELKHHVENNGTDSHFFSRKTMQFFGDTMRNFGVCPATVLSHFDADGNYYENGIEREVWELFRRRPVKNGLRNSAYFDKHTFKRVFAIK